MNEEQLKRRVAELSVQVAAQAGGALTLYQQREVWRECRNLVLDEEWGVESAVTWAVTRRLHVTMGEPWSERDSDQGWSTTSRGAASSAGQAPSTSDPRGAPRFVPPTPPPLDEATLLAIIARGERHLAELIWFDPSTGRLRSRGRPLRFCARAAKATGVQVRERRRIRLIFAG